MIVSPDPSDTPAALDRPRFRGRLHLLAALASVAGLVWMLSVADSPAALVSAWVYGLGAVLLYLTSATYHVFARSPRARAAWQRADHSMIYVLIASTFTPICALALVGPVRWWLLGVVWAGAVLGVTLKLVAFDRLPRLATALYVVLGWVGIVAFPGLWNRPQMLAAVALAGTLYTVGAVLFAQQRPHLSPRWFGYHEVWHTIGVTAGALFFVVNFGLISAH